MSSIGEMLRRERLRRNLELDQISRELKIPNRYLEAIEAERFEGLPAGVFAKNFARQYANLLGLDGDAIAVEVQRNLTPEPAPAESVPQFGAQSEIHLPRMDTWQSIGDRRPVYSSLPALALVVVVMLVCSGVYAFWQQTHHRGGTPPAPVTVAAARQTPPPASAAEPPPAAAVPAAPTASADAPTGPPQASREVTATDRPTPANHAVEPAGAAASRLASDANSAATAGAGPAAAPASGLVHVELNAQEPVWVLARANGKYLFSGTIDANQTRSIDASGTIQLRVGNAGGVQVTLNGKPVGPLGPKGQVRDVQFTSGGFHILAVPSPSPAPGPAGVPPGEPR